MSVDFASIHKSALSRCPDLLHSLLPDGKVQGREYVASGIGGGNGSSLSVNMDYGVWKDFATDEGGSDLISLAAAVKGIRQSEAARVLSDMTGMAVFATPVCNCKDEKPAAIVPVPEGTETPSMGHPRLGMASASYVYRDTQGRLLCYVCRFNKAEAGAKGKPRKEFCPQVWTRQGWKWQALPEPRPLYGLDRLAKTVSEAPVLVLEGEGKADAVQRVLGPNVAVLSLNGGSSGVGKLDCSPLQGRRVFYWPDADEPGYRAGRKFLERARAAGASSVAVVLPPEGVPEGWDAGDAVQEGWDRDRLLAHIKTRQQESSAEPDEEKPEENRILPPPPPVPLEAFPAEVRAMLEEVAEAFTVPLQIPAACLLSFLSCLVGRSRLISIKESWLEAANLWICSVANSGLGKSPCMDAFFRVITRLEYEAKRAFDDEYAAYENELMLYQVQRTAYAKDKAKGKSADPSTLSRPDEPKQRQTTADDVTVEALGDILQGNPKGVLWLKDELSGLLFDLDKYSNSGGGTKARLLSSHSLGPWKTNRTSNPARNNFISKACVSIFGGIQPGMMSKVFEAGAGGIDEESGFLPRFIFIRAIAEAPAYWSERAFSRTSRNLLEDIAGHLWAWNIEYAEGGQEIEKIVSVSPQGKALYIGWYDAIAEEAYLAQNSALLRKLQAHALRLCLVLHCLDAALSKTDGMTSITEDTMRRALLLADWVKIHQEQCWRFFRPEQGAKQADPIERAIMQVVVDEAARIEADGWRIKSAELHSLVENKIGMKGLLKETVAKAASNLGLGSCYMDRGRARSIQAEKISSFKKAVAGVVGVASLTVATKKTTTPPVAEVLQGVVVPGVGNGTNNTYNTCTMPAVVDKTFVPQGQTTPTTPISEDNPEFDFNDPNFPDREHKAAILEALQAPPPDEPTPAQIDHARRMLVDCPSTGGKRHCWHCSRCDKTQTCAAWRSRRADVEFFREGRKPYSLYLVEAEVAQ
jgi:hypothetical protein